MYNHMYYLLNIYVYKIEIANFKNHKYYRWNTDSAPLCYYIGTTISRQSPHYRLISKKSDIIKINL